MARKALILLVSQLCTAGVYSLKQVGNKNGKTRTKKSINADLNIGAKDMAGPKEGVTEGGRAEGEPVIEK